MKYLSNLDPQDYIYVTTDWTTPGRYSVNTGGVIRYNQPSASGYCPELLQEDDMTESNTNRLPLPSGWPGQGPKELPTQRIPTVVQQTSVTFMLVGPQGDVSYEKLASGFGSSATIDERSKTKVAALIALADSSPESKLLVAWPGRTQDIFYVNRDDHATLLEALGFTDAEATPVTVGGKKWVLPK